MIYFQKWLLVKPVHLDQKISVATIYMQIEFDAVKDKQNSVKHGLSLKFAEQLAWDEAYVWIDPRYAYDELRMIGLVPEGDTLYYVAFTDRGEVRRIISLRLAERREIKKYVENNA